MLAEHQLQKKMGEKLEEEMEDRYPNSSSI
jgi:hypothetical protein